MQIWDELKQSATIRRIEIELVSAKLKSKEIEK